MRTIIQSRNMNMHVNSTFLKEKVSGPSTKKTLLCSVKVDSTNLTTNIVKKYVFFYQDFKFYLIAPLEWLYRNLILVYIGVYHTPIFEATRPFLTAGLLVAHLTLIPSISYPNIYRSVVELSPLGSTLNTNVLGLPCVTSKKMSEMTRCICGKFWYETVARIIGPNAILMEN